MAMITPRELHVELVAMVVGASLFVSGCGGQAPPSALPAVASSADPVVTQGPPEVTMTADALYEESRDGGVQTRKKYEGKRFEVTGEVRYCAVKFPNGDVALQMKAPQSTLLSGGLLCFTVDKAPWKTALPGQRVKVHGTYQDHWGLAKLVGCRIMEVSGDPPPALTATQLARQFAADRIETDRQFARGYIVLTGTIASIQVNPQDSNAVVVLKTDLVESKDKDARPIPKVKFTTSKEDASERLKYGQKIKAVGPYESGPGNEVGVRLPELLELEAISTADTALNREMQALQGAWRVTMIEHDKNASVDKPDKLTWVFEGNQLILKNGDRIDDQHDFKLDVTKKPKCLDTSISLGVYSLDGDTLKLLWLGPKGSRPAEVAFKPDQGQMLIHLKRIK
jgi:uncharacterized protein (TIGR03067 family)